MKETLAERVRAGDPRAMARAISLIEDEDPASADLLGAIFRHTGHAYLVGVTGPPGAGKSTLVDRLVAEIRRGAPSESSGGAPRVHAESRDGVEQAHAAPSTLTGAAATVGVIAVDPTSPFTGGAVLADRLRMQAHAVDPGVFIRSMATRGHLGGLARATGDAALVLDAAGKDVVIIETVGVGQDEVDIVRTADVSIVTLVPGAGDEVQALKAGIMEIADIFVVNKADRDGAGELASAVEATLELQTYGPGEWRPPILKTVATSGSGVAELVDAIWLFRAHSEQDLGAGAAGVKAARTRAARRRTRSESRLRELVSQRLLDHLERDVLAPGEWGAIVDRLAAREVDPYTAANDLLRRVVAGLKRP